MLCSTCRSPAFATLVLLVLVGALLSGCASDGRRNFAGMASSEYLLGPGDRVRVIVYGQPDLSNSYRVSQSGKIAMPLIDEVQAAGLSIDELEAEIRRALKDGYLKDPHVALEVEEYRPFFVLGEVAEAGSFAWQQGLSAQKAIALAGGFTDRASTRRVTITRVIDGQIRSARVPLHYPVMPGDTIEVHERLF